jgi:hypothetical protein
VFEVTALPLDARLRFRSKLRNGTVHCLQLFRRCKRDPKILQVSSRIRRRLTPRALRSSSPALTRR